MSSRRSRSLADHVRGWSTEQLSALLHARPDLAMPTPSDSAQLAARSSANESLLRALDMCTAIERSGLEAIASFDDGDTHSLAKLLGADESTTQAIIERLKSLLLVWEDGDRLRVPNVIVTSFGIPSGPNSADIPALIEALPAESKSLLHHLANGGLDGTSALGPESPATPLLSAGLLKRRENLYAPTALSPPQPRLTVTASTRQYYLNGRITNQPATAPPLALVDFDQRAADQIGAGSAAQFLRNVEAIADLWMNTPPAALRAGGVPVRDFKTLSAMLHLGVHEIAMILEVMHAAGLTGHGDVETPTSVYEGWLPTPDYDQWLEQSSGHRWTRLVDAWWMMPRRPALVGSRSRNSTGAVNALSAEIDSPQARVIRRFTLTELGHSPAGKRLAAGTGVASLLAAMHWRRPVTTSYPADLAEEALTEAAWLGLIARDGMTSPARSKVEGSNNAADLLDALLPEPVDHLMIQADLTAIAPGPLIPELARTLADIADVESRGGATVYRFTADSIRRGLDLGHDAAAIRDILATASTTPLPQALEYLIDDVARRFGTIRIGSAQVFLRSEDETALTEIVHDKRAADLHLYRIAPTVVVSESDPVTVLTRLRSMGAAPVLEARDGTLHITRPEVRRAPRSRSSAPRSTVIDDARIAATIVAIQSGDRARTTSHQDLAHSPQDILTLLRRAIGTETDVVISYAGQDGTVMRRIVRPLRLDGGRLTGFDERADMNREFVVHRITSAAVFEPPQTSSGPH